MKDKSLKYSGSYFLILSSRRKPVSLKNIIVLFPDINATQQANHIIFAFYSLF